MIESTRSPSVTHDGEHFFFVEGTLSELLAGELVSRLLFPRMGSSGWRTRFVLLLVQRRESSVR
jgi:hypothetical protein